MTDIGADRQASHEGHSSPRFDRTDPGRENRIGAYAELDFARRYHLLPPPPWTGEGDPGYDFCLPNGWRIDVKGVAKQPWMFAVKLRDLERATADCYALGWVQPDSTVVWQGWHWRETFLTQGTLWTAGQLGRTVYLPLADLREMHTWGLGDV